MKKSSRITALVLALAMLLTLAACGGRKDEPEVIDYPGYYILTSMNGEDLSSYTTMYLVLSDDGTGYVHSADGETSDITWDFDKITWQGEELRFTVDAEKLTMIEEDSKTTLVFTRSNEEPPAKEAASSEAGFYVATSMTKGTTSMDAEEIEAQYGPLYLVFNETGPSYARNTNGEIITITWGSGKMSWQDGASSYTLFYTLDGDELTIVDEGITIVFTRSGKEPPAVDGAPSEAPAGAPAASEAGYYIAAYMTSGSSYMSKEELEAEYGRIYLVLNEDGPSYARDARGEVTEITWGSGKIIWQDETYSYTLDGDQLTLEYNGDTMGFTRSNERPPKMEETPAIEEASSEAPAEAPDASRAGYYVLTSMNGEDMTSYTTMYIVLYEDGTGYAHSADGESIDITWDSSKITWWGEELYYTLDGDKLTMTEGGGEVLVFTRSSEEPVTNG